MAKTINFYLFLLLISESSISSYAQKNFNMEISFSGATFNDKNLDINFYTGYEVQTIQTTSIKKFNVSLSSNLQYPIIEIFYRSSKSKLGIYRFFLLKKNTTLEIKYNVEMDSMMIGGNIGMMTFKSAGLQKFERFAKTEVKTLQNFEQRHANDFSNSNTLELDTLSNHMAAVRNKAMAFIKDNPKSLYGLWFFMDQIIGKPDYSFTYLNNFYRKYLQPNFLNSFENKLIIDQLDSNRLGINTKAPFINETFKDLTRKSFQIKNLNKRYLLVTIWATWCVPCVAELPKLKQLYTEFKNKFEILSFSTDRDKIILQKFIKKNKMDWINVFGRYDFTKVYGSDKGIPQIYLLDTKGKIVYSRMSLKDYDLKYLENMLEQL